VLCNVIIIILTQRYKISKNCLRVGEAGVAEKWGEEDVRIGGRAESAMVVGGIDAPAFL